MKKSIIPFLSFLFVLLFFLPSPGNGQSREQRTFLRYFADSIHLELSEKRMQAHRKAESLGIPSRIETRDYVMELQFFREEVPYYYTTHNLDGANAMKTSHLWPLGAANLDLTGHGQILGMWDAGAVRVSHREFRDRINMVDGASSSSSHATHVAATMVAGGNDINARGMAYRAELNAYDWNEDLAEMATAAAAGLKVSQHSYGFVTGWRRNTTEDRWEWWGSPSISETQDYRFGYYDMTARQWDLVANNAPNYLIVKSAGNDRGMGPAPGTEHYVWQNGGWVFSTAIRDKDGGESGYNTISTNGNSKNILTVGAVTSNGNMSFFSGWGPTDDGRIKPDIVAKGVGVYSAIATADTAYASYNGTSMAGPMVSGSVGLLLQHQQNLHGTENPLWASTMKALVLHSATGLVGHPGPDYRNGWGFMNTRLAAEIMTENKNLGGDFFIRERTLSNGESLSFNVVATGKEPLKVTIVWNDPAAVVLPPALNNPSPRLVNDLDVRISNPMRDVYYPWVLDPENPSNNATHGDNFRDNVEQVYIANPMAGLQYTVTISHKGQLSMGKQDFAVIITGIDDQDPIETFPLTLTTNLPGAGVVSGEGAYPQGFEMTVRVTPSRGFIFESWTDENQNVVSLTPEFDFTMLGQAKTFSANFTQVPLYNVSLHIDPAAGGQATGADLYMEGETVHVSLIPETGYTFIDWTDGQGNFVSNETQFSFTMPDRDLTFFANLDINRYTLSLSGSGQGNVLINNAWYDEPLIIDHGTPIRMQAVAENGWKFSNWSGDLISLVNPVEFTMTRSRHINVAFNLLVDFNLTLLSDPVFGGTTLGAGLHRENTDVLVTATPNPGFRFLRWSDVFGNELSTDSIFVFNMPSSNRIIKADFGYVVSSRPELAERFRIYPNPVINLLYIEYPDIIDRITIFDITGRAIIDQKANSHNVSVSLDGVIDGVYFVRLLSGNSSETFRVVKQQ